MHRALDTNDWKSQHISSGEVLQLLHDKIDQISIDQVKEDVVRFIPFPDVLKIWSKDYFHQLVEKIKFENPV